MVASLYDNQEENKTIWVYLEHEECQLERVSLELLGHGRALADEMNCELAASVLAPDGAEIAKHAIAHGADRVYLCEHPLLEFFTIEAFSHSTYQAIMRVKPSVLLLGATPNGRDLAGRLAVRLEHVTSQAAYDDCEGWFADCHEEAYEHFEQVMARR